MPSVLPIWFVIASVKSESTTKVFASVTLATVKTSAVSDAPENNETALPAISLCAVEAIVLFPVPELVQVFARFTHSPPLDVLLDVLDVFEAAGSHRQNRLPF